MNFNGLVAALRDSAQAARKDLNAAQFDGRARWAHIASDSLEPFVEALCSDPSLRVIDGRKYAHPSGSTLVDFRHAACYMVERAISLGPEVIIEDLQRFARTSEVDLLRVRAIEGVSLDGSIDLGEGCSIVPPADLPQVLETQMAFSPK